MPAPTQPVTQPMIGPLEDFGYGVAVDGQGNVVVAGRAMGVLEGVTTRGTGGGFVSKFAADGAWLWTQQYGTSGSDMITAVAVALDGDIVIAGSAGGPHGLDPAQGAPGVFVARLDPDGELRWATPLGARGVSFASALAVSADGRICLAGKGPQDSSKDQAEVLALCTGEHALDAIVDQLAANHADTPRDRIERETLALLDELSHRGLIEDAS